MFRRTASSTVAVVLACLVFGAQDAHATTMSMSPNGFTSLQSVGWVRVSAGIINVSCMVSLSTSLNASTATRAFAPLGSVVNASASSCIGGTMTFGFLSWPLEIASMLGTLPNFSGVLIRAVSIRFTAVVAGQSCTYGGMLELLAPNDYGASFSGRLSVANLLANSFTLRSGSALCPVTASWSTPQQFTFSPLQGIVIL